jgi:hypothetical protein
MELFIVASLVGVVLGAALQYSFSQRAERKRNLDLRRTDAYVDLIRSVAALLSVDDKVPGDELRQVQNRYAEARARIVIYGSPRVVSSLGAFLRMPASAQPGDLKVALAEVVKAMRLDGIGSREALDDQDIQQILSAPRGG